MLTACRACGCAAVWLQVRDMQAAVELTSAKPKPGDVGTTTIGFGAPAAASADNGTTTVGFGGADTSGATSVGFGTSCLAHRWQCVALCLGSGISRADGRRSRVWLWCCCADPCARVFRCLRRCVGRGCEGIRQRCDPAGEQPQPHNDLMRASRDRFVTPACACGHCVATTQPRRKEATPTTTLQVKRKAPSAAAPEAGAGAAATTSEDVPKASPPKVQRLE